MTYFANSFATVTLFKTNNSHIAFLFYLIQFVVLHIHVNYISDIQRICVCHVHSFRVTKQGTGEA